MAEILGRRAGCVGSRGTQCAGERGFLLTAPAEIRGRSGSIVGVLEEIRQLSRICGFAAQEPAFILVVTLRSPHCLSHPSPGWFPAPLVPPGADAHDGPLPHVSAGRRAGSGSRSLRSHRAVTGTLVEPRGAAAHILDRQSAAAPRRIFALVDRGHGRACVGHHQFGRNAAEPSGDPR